MKRYQSLRRRKVNGAIQNEKESFKKIYPKCIICNERRKICCNDGMYGKLQVKPICIVCHSVFNHETGSSIWDEKTCL